MNAADRLTLLPSPAHLSVLGGTLDLRDAVVDTRADSTTVSPALRALRAGLALHDGGGQGQARIVLHLDETRRVAPDGYAIVMDGDEVLIRAMQSGCDVITETGIAANQSFNTGLPVRVADLIRWP